MTGGPAVAPRTRALGRAVWTIAGKNSLRLFAIGFVLGGSIVWASASHAKATNPARIDAGEWQFSEIDGPARRRVCVADPAALSAAFMTEKSCVRLVLQNERDVLVTHFICRGGNIRRVVRVWAARSVRLETQGILHGAPFGVDYDARRVGNCSNPAGLR